MNNDSENLILQINEYTKKCRLFMGYLYVCCLKSSLLTSRRATNTSEHGSALS